eukprot:2341938-Amphidinium_carterae.1
MPLKPNIIGPPVSLSNSVELFKRTAPMVPQLVVRKQALTNDLSKRKDLRPLRSLETERKGATTASKIDEHYETVFLVRHFLKVFCHRPGIPSARNKSMKVRKSVAE